MRIYTNVRQFGNKILVRGYLDSKRFQQEIEYEPYIFVKCDKPTEYKTVHGEYVSKEPMVDIYSAKAYIEVQKDTGALYGMTKWPYVYIHDNFPGEIHYDMKDISVAYLDIEVDSANGFPNITLANKEVTAITLSNRKNTVAFAFKDDYIPSSADVVYIKCKNETDLLERFLKCWNVMDPDIITGWNVVSFDLPYLIRRLNNRLGNKVANKLSPWGWSAIKQEMGLYGKPKDVGEISGRQVLDYLELYKKFAMKMQANAFKESYKLEDVSQHELGEGKVDYHPYRNLNELYQKDFKRFMDYNIKDVKLIMKLEDKLRFIEQALTLAYDAKVNYTDVYTSVRMWDVIAYNYLMDKNIVIPHFEASRGKRQIAGAYVKEVKAGMYNWVVSFDLNSLYPHLIMQYNISPECLVGMNDRYAGNALAVDQFLEGDLVQSGIQSELLRNNQTICPTGAVFSREAPGFLTELMSKIYDDRVIYKKKKLEASQKLVDVEAKLKANPNNNDLCIQKKHWEFEVARNGNMDIARKIQLNSAYGALANEYFRWFDSRLAESITLSGQLSIRWIETKINNKLNQLLKTKDKDYIIGADTDSVYICMDEIVKQHMAPNLTKEEIVEKLDQICIKVLEPYIDKSYDELAQYVNAFNQKMRMKREVIADKGIWTAKKHYLLNVWNSEGVKYKEPKSKIVGLEAVKSSTPLICRQAIKDVFKIILNGTEAELRAYHDKFEEEFLKADVAAIAFPRGINELYKWADPTFIAGKGTPIHVRGALVYNHFLKEKGIENQYISITEGNKIKYVYLIDPNPLHSHVIGFESVIPPEFGLLESHIDRKTMFQKTFLKPLEDVLKAVNWRINPPGDLTVLFEILENQIKTAALKNDHEDEDDDDIPY